jgi:TRAP-type transport system periplasmic protein
MDRAVTGTATGNANKLHKLTTRLYTLYVLNPNWRNKLNPNVRQLLETTTIKMALEQTELGAEIAHDRIDSNTGRPACKHGTLIKDPPMVEVKPTDADKAPLKSSWRRCPSRPG